MVHKLSKNTLNGIRFESRTPFFFFFFAKKQRYSIKAYKNGNMSIKKEQAVNTRIHRTIKNEIPLLFQNIQH